MNMSSRRRATRRRLPIDSFSYRDIAAVSEPNPTDEVPIDEPAPQMQQSSASASLTEDAVERMLTAARLDAESALEAKLVARHAVEMQRERERIGAAIAHFAGERRTYFGEVERDVVELALAIAARIMHRESTLDPSLLVTLVRSALDRLDSSSIVSVRVAPHEVEWWNAQLRQDVDAGKVLVVCDDTLHTGDCRVQTSVGSADFSLAAQLKEVELGFADLLSRRPDTR